MMTAEDGIAPGTDQMGETSAYHAARAQWHRHRAAVATDSSIKNLHERFARLYSASAETGSAK